MQTFTLLAKNGSQWIEVAKAEEIGGSVLVTLMYSKQTNWLNDADTSEVSAYMNAVSRAYKARHKAQVKIVKSAEAKPEIQEVYKGELSLDIDSDVPDLSFDDDHEEQASAE